MTEYWMKKIFPAAPIIGQTGEDGASLVGFVLLKGYSSTLMRSFDHDSTVFYFSKFIYFMETRDVL
jgi:hypothetical protein